MIKGILFDKDGTLIDFFSLWLGAANTVVKQLLQENQLPGDMQDCILKAMGVEDGKIDPHGGLAYKSYGEIAEDITNALAEQQICLDCEKMKMQLERLFDGYVMENQAQYVETASAKNCLTRLGVLEKFDYIGADDKVLRPKPEADMFLEFQRKFGLQPYEIAVVGDTYNDIRFARENGGIAIGVLSGVSRTKDFAEEADYILQSVEELPRLLEQI